MTIYVRSSLVTASPDAVFAHTTCLRGFRQVFPFPLDWRDGPEAWSEGDTLDFRYRSGGVWISHVARIVEWEPGRRFVDEMSRGIFKTFRHTHLFEPSTDGTLITDRVEFTLGYGTLVDRSLALPILVYSFRKRHEALQACFK